MILCVFRSSSLPVNLAVPSKTPDAVDRDARRRTVADVVNGTGDGSHRDRGRQIPGRIAGRSRLRHDVGNMLRQPAGVR